MATSKNFVVKNGLEVGGQEVIDSSGVVTSVALGGQTLGTTDSPSFANLTLTGYLRGPASFTIDPAAHGDDTGTVVIAGNLQVDGTTTTINSTTMTVDDLNIVLASGAADATAANGAGITIDGASASLTYSSTADGFSFNKDLDVTGTVTADGLTVDGNGRFTGTAPALTLFRTDSLSPSARIRMVGSDNADKWEVATNYLIGGAGLEFNYAGSNLAFMSTAGNLGIGTSSPNTSLQVAGNSFIGVTTVAGMSPQTGLTVVGGASVENLDPGILTLGSHGNSRTTNDILGQIDFYSNDASTGASGVQASIRGITEAANGSTSGLSFYTGTSSSLPERMRITSTGELRLTGNGVLRNQESGGNFSYLQQTSSDARLFVQYSQPLLFGTNSTERMRIDSSGDVAIGDPVANSKLTVSDAAGAKITLKTGSNIASSVQGIEVYDRQGTANFPSDPGQLGGYMYVERNGSSGEYGLTFGTAYGISATASERMRISANGNVGIGTSSPNQPLETVSSTFAYNRTRSTNGAYTGFDVGQHQSGQAVLNLRDSNFMQFLTNDTERMRIDSSGRVGIGTSSPSSQLQVFSPRFPSGFSDYGPVMITQEVNAATDNNAGAGVAPMEPILTFNRFGASNVKFDPFADFSIGSYTISGVSPRTRLDLRLMHNTDSMSNIMTWLSSGNVGIGTTSPDHLLTISGSNTDNLTLLNSTAAPVNSANPSPSLLFQSNAWDTNIGSTPYRGSIQLEGNYTAGSGATFASLVFKLEGSETSPDDTLTEYMRIKSNGYVGIGTSSPAAYLDVNYTSMFRGDAAAGSVVHTTTFRNTRNGTWNIARIEAEAGGQVWAGGLVFKTASSSFANTLVEHMRLDENGNLGIGRSSPAYRLDVSSPSTADNSVIAQFQPTTGSNGLTIRRYNVGADNDRTGLYFQNENVINTRLWVDDTGDVRVSASTPTSDTDGTVVGTQTFTGTHIYKTDETDLEIGEAVCLVGKKIVRSSSAKSKTVAGIYAGESWKVVDSFGDKCRDADGQPVNGAGHAVIALGDTRFFQSGSSSVGVLVDGPVQAGDLLCTSSVPGRLTVQEDDLMHSYTVAKAMEDGDNTAPIYAYVYSG